MIVAMRTVMFIPMFVVIPVMVVGEVAVPAFPPTGEILSTVVIGRDDICRPIKSADPQSALITGCRNDTLSPTTARKSPVVCHVLPLLLRPRRAGD